MFTEWAPGAMELIIGVITIVGSLWTAIEVLKRRAEKNAEDIKADIKKSSDGDRTRLGRVETEVGRLDKRVTDLDARMTTGFRSVDKRFNEVEKAMVSLATKEDVNTLQVSQARTDSRMETLLRNDDELKGMIQHQGEAFARLSAEILKRQAG